MCDSLLYARAVQASVQQLGLAAICWRGRARALGGGPGALEALILGTFTSLLAGAGGHFAPQLLARHCGLRLRPLESGQSRGEPWCGRRLRSGACAGPAP